MPSKKRPTPLGIDLDHEERRARALSKIFGIYKPEDDLPASKKRAKKKKKAPSVQPISTAEYLRDLRLLAKQRLHGKCNWCPSRDPLTYDHIYPKSKGGCNCKANIQVLCKTCNGRKGDVILLDKNGQHFGHTKKECQHLR